MDWNHLYGQQNRITLPSSMRFPFAWSLRSQPFFSTPWVPSNFTYKLDSRCLWIIGRNLKKQRPTCFHRAFSLCKALQNVETFLSKVTLCDQRIWRSPNSGKFSPGVWRKWWRGSEEAKNTWGVRWSGCKKKFSHWHEPKFLWILGENSLNCQKLHRFYSIFSSVFSQESMIFFNFGRGLGP